MADLFSQDDAISLLFGKSVLLIGDSNTRALYKDILWLLCKSTVIPDGHLKTKRETSFLGDVLTSGSRASKSRDYMENRKFTRMGLSVEFNFVTQVYSNLVKSKLNVFARHTEQVPHVVLLNSTLWDINRWGPIGDLKFQEDLIYLMEHLKCCLPQSTLVVWLTALYPSSQKTCHALVPKQLECVQNSQQVKVLEANTYAASTVKAYGFNVLDLHYYIRLLCHLRRPDGIHYDSFGTRYITNLVLTHLAQSWDAPLPGRMRCLETDHVHREKLVQGQHCQSSQTADGSRTVLQAQRKLTSGRILAQSNQVISSQDTHEEEENTRNLDETLDYDLRDRLNGKRFNRILRM